jgi:NADPH:quinone reductase-like Zn-dependent oxidoreductase
VIEHGDLLWRERPDPQIADSEVLVAVRAAGVNGSDPAQLRGQYPAPPGAPADIPGLELAGEVVKVGARVKRFMVGDRVMALVGGGAHATLAAVDEAHALPVPDSLVWPAAGGFMEVFATAFDALFNQAQLTLGDRLLVTGAAGGVGTAAVQLGALAGAHVVAAVRNPDHRGAVAELGAAEVIEPKQVSERGPYDVVLELVGAASLPDALEGLAITGRVAVIGIGSGAKVSMDLRQLMAKRVRLSASNLRSRSREEKAGVVVTLGARVLPLLESGRLRVPVSTTFPLQEAAGAYESFSAGGKLGKIVLTA